MEQHTSIIISVIGIFTSILVTAFVIGWKAHVDRELDKASATSTAIKSNYVQQFADVRAAIAEAKLSNERQLNDAVNELKDVIRENCVNNEICKERHNKPNINSIFK